MPLLNKEPFVPVPVPHNLSPDDEVFYLPLTNEIFTSHDAFFERSILTNSLVWTCSVSGRTPLTYEEALESESQSKILIQTFPKPMQIPILYLIRYITTSASRDICDMIYAFVCNRYFLGETVDIIKNDQKLSGHITRVIPPSEDESKRCLTENQGKTVSYGVDPHLYKYQVEMTDGNGKVHSLFKIDQASELQSNNQHENSEVVVESKSLGENGINDSDNKIIIEANNIIRPKGLFNKDRLRLFLRHHLAETKRNQVFDIKEETKELYNLKDVEWTDIFDGPEPRFDRKNNILVKIKEPTLTKDTSTKVMKQTNEDEDIQRKRKLSENEAGNGTDQPPKKKKKKKEAENSSETNVENQSKKKKKKRNDGESGEIESKDETGEKSKKKGPKPKNGASEAATPKKKKYPYDPHKYDMPVPADIDPDLLTSTGKIDGRKLKNKKNKDLAEELLATKTPAESVSPKKRGPKPGSHKKKSQEKDIVKPEKATKKKTKTPAEIAKEKELEVKRKKEASLLAKQLEKQKREEERKAIAAFLQEWEKKCEDLERDDLRPLPSATPIDCDIPQEHFGDALYIMEVFYNFHEIFSGIKDVCPTGIDFDTLEEILLDKNEDSALGTVIQYLLSTIFRLQPTHEGLGVEDESKETAIQKLSSVADNAANNIAKLESELPPNSSDQTQSADHINLEVDNENGVDGVSDIDEDEHNKEIDMNDLIGSAIKAAQDVQASITQPLIDIELDSSNITEVLRLHLLQSGTYPKSRSVYNGWYSAREDPGLWLCMREPELLKKLSETTIFDLNIDERVKLIHALINQVFSFISTRAYIETASERLNELRKEYRATAAAFARWERENCVKKMQQPKRKNDQTQSNEKSDNEVQDREAQTLGNENGEIKEHGFTESSHGDVNEISKLPLTNGSMKSCLKINGHNVHGDDTDIDENISNDESILPTKKKITFKLDSAITTTKVKNVVINNEIMTNGENSDTTNEQEPTFEDLERVYEENLIAYDEYQLERGKRLEEHNSQLLSLRTSIRNVQSLYGIHPIGRDRAYRRYWLFQSLPGLFVESDDMNFGPCLEEATPTESRFRLKFNRDNPADLQRGSYKPKSDSELHHTNGNLNGVSIKENIEDRSMIKINGDSYNNSEDQPSSSKSDQAEDDPERNSTHQFEEMARCSADENNCFIHGKKNSESQPRWWFYHSAESVDYLIETLNKRGTRESELLETLIAEKSTIRDWVSRCPSYKLNKLILEQSGIRRSRRLRLKTHKRRTRAVSYE